MNTKHYIFVWVIALLCSCNNYQEPVNIYTAENAYMIIKFEEPEYAHYVVAFRSASVYEVCNLPMIESEKGKEPYVYLGDGYYLSKWSWWYSLYPIRYHENYFSLFLIDTLWTDFSSELTRYAPAYEQHLSGSTAIVQEPVTEIYLYKYKENLDKYLGLNYKEMMPEKFRSKNILFDYDLTEFMNPYIFSEDFEGKDEYIAVCDSIGQIYMSKIQEAFNTDRKRLLKAGIKWTHFYNNNK